MNVLKINGQALEGIYVDAAISFNKPARNVSTYSIPGRNGDLVVDEGTFDNVLITYPVFEKNTFPTEFDEIVNYLASLEGYQKIECSNDPQHYRLGRFVVPQNPTAKRLNRDGYWQLSFDCKPQRWLLSGEEDTEIDANPIDEYSGDIVSFDAVALDEITELKAAIEPAQDLNGYDNPWPAGGGKNKFDADTVYSAYKQSDGSFLGTGSEFNNIHIAIPDTLVGQELAFSAMMRIPSGSTIANIRVRAVVGGTQKTGNIVTGNEYALSQVIFTPTSTADYIFMTYGSYGNQNMQFKDVQLELGSTATDFAPYSNICPISGHTEVNIHVADGETPHIVDNIYPISLDQTVYGGTLNVTTGVLTITQGTITMDGVGSSDEGLSFYKKASTTFVDQYYTRVPYTTAEGGHDYTEFLCNIAPSTPYPSEADPSVPIGFCLWDGTSRWQPRLYWQLDAGIDTLEKANQWLAAMNAAGTPVVYTYFLATPTTVQLTATEVELLLGQNNIWADTGNVEVKVTTPTVFNNPSLFNSKPLIRVYGVGTFRVNDITVTIASHTEPYIDIDCELQECYYEDTNMNSYVSFSGNDFPELQPGANYMLLASGITKLDVTPRWWIL